MASYIKTLKEDNGDITYPQTLASAVITAGGSDVDSALATKANISSLAAVATSGLYSDLSGTPNLATVATTGSYNDLTNLPSDRLFRMLVPTGTEITSNKNLATTEFLSVGRYYCSANATVATLTNCPTSSAFMMEVFSPLSTTIDNETTDTWVYRLRLLTTYTGETWVQQVDSGSTAGSFTYRTWKRYSIPDIKSATAVSDCGWESDKNKIPDCSMLAYWNGAYSGTSSNLKYLANNCIGANHFNQWSTANTSDTWVPVCSGNNIQHRVIKAFNADGTIPKSAMHGLPCPDYSTVITAWGTINSTSTKTTSADGYIIGKAIVTGSDKQALIEIGGKQVAGIPYNATSQISNFQVAFCIPVKSGTSVKFQCSGGTGGYFQGCNLIGWQM